MTLDFAFSAKPSDHDTNKRSSYRLRPPRYWYFVRVSITTPVVPVLNSYHAGIISVPLIQGRPLDNAGSEEANWDNTN